MTDEELEPLAPYLTEAIESVVDYGRATERIIAAYRQTSQALEAVTSIAELDPFLAPELGAAAEHLNAVAEALDRAHTALRSRFDVRWNIPHTEGPE